MTQPLNRASYTFPVGAIVRHFSSNETFRVVTSLPYRTLVVSIDDVEIFFATVDLTIAN